MAKPLVSVILSNGRQRSFEAAVSSIKAQTLTSYEIVSGQSLNQGLREAQGDYIAFLNPDDVWVRDKLEKQIAGLMSYPDAQWSYCQNFPVRGYSGRRQTLRRLLLDNSVAFSSVLVRRNVCESAGDFDESGRYGGNEDWDMCLRLATAYTVHVVEGPLVRSGTPVPKSETEIEKTYKGKIRVIEAAVARNREELADLRSEALARNCISAGSDYLRLPDEAQARQKFAEALTHDPHCSDAYLSWILSFLSPEARQQVSDLKALSRYTQAGSERARELSSRH